MSIVLPVEAPPLRQEDDGAIRVGESRVLLEMVIHSFQGGSSPETIVQQFPTLQLPDVYAVIAYYLRHQEAVEAYLAERDRQGDEVRRKIEAIQGDTSGLRARLQARRPKQG
jgi:uncharacterized protein (DUF433 family)